MTLPSLTAQPAPLNGATVVPVQSQPTKLSDNMGIGTLLYNQSQTNKIWVSSSSSVSPGNGIPIGALGSLKWIANSPLWAVMDTGTTTPTVVSWTNQAQDPVNPVDVGEAVAIAIAALGIPNTLLQNVILPATAFPAGTTLPNIDVHEYASVIINNSFPGVTGQATVIQYQFLDGAGNLCNSGTFGSPANPTLGIAPPTMILPVKGVTLRLSNGSASSTGNVTVSGSNRPCNGPTCGADFNGGQQLSISGTPLAAGTHDMGTLSVDKGLSSFEFYVIGGVVKGIFNMVTYDGQTIGLANTTEMQALPNADTVVAKTLVMPSNGLIEVQFLVQTAGNTGGIFCRSMGAVMT